MVWLSDRSQRRSERVLDGAARLVLWYLWVATPVLVVLRFTDVVNSRTALMVGVIPLLVAEILVVVRARLWRYHETLTGGVGLGLLAVSFVLPLSPSAWLATSIAGSVFLVVNLTQLTMIGFRANPQQSVGLRAAVEPLAVFAAVGAWFIAAMGPLWNTPGNTVWERVGSLIVAPAVASMGAVPALLLLVRWRWRPGPCLWMLGVLLIMASLVLAASQGALGVDKIRPVIVAGLLVGGVVNVTGALQRDLTSMLDGTIEWRSDRAWQRRAVLTAATVFGVLSRSWQAMTWYGRTAAVLAALGIALLSLRYWLLNDGLLSKRQRPNRRRRTMTPAALGPWFEGVRPEGERDVELSVITLLPTEEVHRLQDAEQREELNRQLESRVGEAVGPTVQGADGEDGTWELCRDGEQLLVVWARPAGAQEPMADVVEELCGLLSQRLTRPFQTDGRFIRAEYAIGFAVRSLAPGDPVEGLVQDSAWAARSATADKPTGYDPARRESILRRAQLGAMLDRSVALLGESSGVSPALSGFSLVFEPVVDVLTGETVAAETLARWSVPGLGRVSPGEFIPIAEQTGAMSQLGEWVLEEACARAAVVDQGHHIAVNLAGSEVASPLLYDRVCRALDSSGLDPRKLILEVTETVVDAAVEQGAAALRKLADLGVQLYLDDFGAASSGMSRLVALPWSVIKLDRWFIAGLDSVDGARAALIGSTADLAARLGVETLAEGVEDIATLRLVSVLGCKLVQGWVFGQGRVTLEQAWRRHLPRDFAPPPVIAAAATA